jgi:hypothetical protein
LRKVGNIDCRSNTIFSVQSQVGVTFLLVWAVTEEAILREHRQHVTRKIDFFSERRRPGGQQAQDHEPPEKAHAIISKRMGHSWMAWAGRHGARTETARASIQSYVSAEAAQNEFGHFETVAARFWQRLLKQYLPPFERQFTARATLADYRSRPAGATPVKPD